MTQTASDNRPKAFVIGWPISHSKSPIIHNHWIAQYGLTSLYEKVAVEPDKLGDFLKTLSDQGYAGGNVTLPHKESVLLFVDVLHPTAKRLGAANTIWLEDGRLHADNTDGYGFLANLDQHQPGWDETCRGQSALVLGAGGACRPIIDGLLSRGVKNVTLVNRTRERAEEVASLFKNDPLDNHQSGKVQVADWDQRADLAQDQSLLVNTTALGMVNQPPLEMDLSLLSRHALVADIVYTPLMTELLAAAKERGNPIVDGVGMLLHQAVPGFEKWFGKWPEVTDQLRKLVLGQEA